MDRSAAGGDQEQWAYVYLENCTLGLLLLLLFCCLWGFLLFFCRLSVFLFCVSWLFCVYVGCGFYCLCGRMGVRFVCLGDVVGVCAPVQECDRWAHG